MEVRSPLHIKMNDQSQEARTRRAEHAVTMATLNPQGFRQPGIKSTRYKNRFGGGTSFCEKRAKEAGMM